MGLYRSVVKPLSFALPPETSHCSALWCLRLPLPWSLIGGAVEDPGLETDLAGIRLRNPVGLASGFDKDCRRLAALGKLGFGYLVGGTLTRRPRAGNPRPRLVRLAKQRSAVNSMGLPNAGVEAAAAHLARLRKTAPVLVSLADEEVADVSSGFELLRPHIDGFELNVSCPNVSWGRDRDNEAHLRSILAALASVREKPLFVKLPPFGTDAEREAVLALARIAVEAGASGLTCSNSRPVEEPRLAGGTGGLSGAVLADATPHILSEVRRAVEGVVPINACGGVGGAEDARRCLEAGATTVQLYTALVYEGPRLLREITTGLVSAAPAARD